VSYLLDTSVLSELLRPKPDAKVTRWFRVTPEETLHLSVLSLGELHRGIEGAKGARKDKLRAWLERDLRERLADRLLPVTSAVADRWGRLLAQVDHGVPGIDSLLAATALAHGLRIVTRRERDFGFPGLEVVNPWEAGAETRPGRATGIGPGGPGPRGRRPPQASPARRRRDGRRRGSSRAARRERPGRPGARERRSGSSRSRGFWSSRRSPSRTASGSVGARGRR
jgi:predicted nucleic acid-binding protein